MNHEETFTRWVDRLNEGDNQAVEHLFNKYFDRLIRLAVRKMHGLNAVPRSGEDIAMSAVKSFCLGIRDKKIALTEETDIWGCLFLITTRKACAERRKSFAARRGKNQQAVSGNQTEDETDEAIFNRVAGKEPSPELAIELAENADELLSLFKNKPTQHAIISMKLQGYSNQEIADQTKLGLRSIFYHLNQIQSKWMFFKSLEYLVDNLFDRVSFFSLSESLNMSEEIVIAVVEKMLDLWSSNTDNDTDRDMLHLKLFQPREYEALCVSGHAGALAMESKTGHIQRRWSRLIRSEWGSKLEALVKSMTPSRERE